MSGQRTASETADATAYADVQAERGQEVVLRLAREHGEPSGDSHADEATHRMPERVPP